MLPPLTPSPGVGAAIIKDAEGLIRGLWAAVDILRVTNDSWRNRKDRERERKRNDENENHSFFLLFYNSHDNSFVLIYLSIEIKGWGNRRE